MEERGYRVVSFPPERRLQADTAWIQRRKHTISGLFEVDITGVRERLRQHRAATGESYSFTAYLIWRLAQAVDENKEVQAMRDWRNQLVIFDDVDVATLIEINLQDRNFPLLQVIRAANRRSFRQIHEEIRAIQANPTRSENFGERKQNQARWFLALPAAARRL
jgi:chloramphenicol O-acetyltransferase